MTQTEPAGEAGRGYQLRVGCLDQVAVSVALAPQHSVTALVRQAASGPPAGKCAALRQRLRPQSRFAFGTFATPGSVTMPECCQPLSPTASATVAEQVGRLRDLPGQVLLDEMRGAVGEHLPDTWAPAGNQPKRWLRSWADVCVDAWEVLGPRWRQAGPLLDREIRRVGTAVVSGGLDALLNSLHPRISCTDGLLCCSFPWDRCRELGQRRLVLVPMLAGASTIMVSYERPAVAYLGYPIRRPHPPRSGSGSGSGSAASDPLALVLGPARADALRELRRPLTVSQLAAAIGCAPNTATYHVQHLAAAGLVTRERRGPSVQVSRTQRGAELADLLSASQIM